MKKFRVKDWVLMGLSLAMMIVIGKVLYSLSLALPIPSSRVLTTAPVFAFIYTATILKTRKIGTVTLISICYGIYMLRFSVFGALAGVLSGVISDILTIIIFRNYESIKNIIFSVPIRSSVSVWTSFFIVNIFVPNSRFVQAGIIPTIIITLIIYAVGLVVSKYTVNILSKRLVYE